MSQRIKLGGSRLLQLPDEMFSDEIFQYLDSSKDLYNIKLTCKEFARILDQYPWSYKNAEFTLRNVNWLKDAKNLNVVKSLEFVWEMDKEIEEYEFLKNFTTIRIFYYSFGITNQERITNQEMWRRMNEDDSFFDGFMSKKKQLDDLLYKILEKANKH